jgi:hypothetical protein
MQASVPSCGGATRRSFSNAPAAHESSNRCANSVGPSRARGFATVSTPVKLLVSIVFLAFGSLHAQDPLPSWNDTAPKKAIAAFVEKVTKEGSPDYVPPNERIATFDNDGTLWAEQPIYFQFLFAMDRIKALAPQHPEWKTKEPFKSVLAGDAKVLLASGEKGLLEIMARTHAGMTTTEFDQIAREW